MKIILITLLIMILTLGIAGAVLAQEGPEEGAGQNPEEGAGGPTPGETETQLSSPVGHISLAQLIGKIIRAFLGIVGTISLIMFIYAGFLLITAAGKSSQIQKGQQTMVWAVLGIVAIFMSYAVLNFVFSIFGL